MFESCRAHLALPVAGRYEPGEAGLRDRDQTSEESILKLLGRRAERGDDEVLAAVADEFPHPRPACSRAAVQERIERRRIHSCAPGGGEEALDGRERVAVGVELPRGKEVLAAAVYRDGEELACAAAGVEPGGVGAEAGGEPGSREGVVAHVVELRAARGTGRPCRAFSLPHQATAVAGCCTAGVGTYAGW